MRASYNTKTGNTTLTLSELEVRQFLSAQEAVQVVRDMARNAKVLTLNKGSAQKPTK